MSDTARDYQTVAPASTEGLEDLFDVSDITVQDTVQVKTIDVQDTVRDEITVVEASRLLNVDRRSVVRLLNWNKLSGRKDERGKWLISRLSVVERIHAQDIVQDTVHAEVQDGVQQNSTHVLDVSETKDLHVQDTVLQVIKEQADQLKQAYTYLDAATARVLYMQQLLEQKDQEIKLLTDSQHKPGWWPRFKKWCAGQ